MACQESDQVGLVQGEHPPTVLSLWPHLENSCKHRGGRFVVIVDMWIGDLCAFGNASPTRA